MHPCCVLNIYIAAVVECVIVAYGIFPLKFHCMYRITLLDLQVVSVAEIDNAISGGAFHPCELRLDHHMVQVSLRSAFGKLQIEATMNCRRTQTMWNRGDA